MGVKCYIMQIQPFSVNDGDGIRTTVFLAGCPLRCRWCANPEGFSRREIIGWYKRKCIGCGSCVSVCPQGIGIDMNSPSGGTDDGRDTGLERDRCISCGACADACPEGARTRMVSLMDADEVLENIQKHRLFYSYSGGGVTFSGGEAASQPETLDYLTRNLYDMGYSMDIETSGYFEWDRVCNSLSRMDLIFMDLKMMDPKRHRLYTGVSNERILSNMAKLGMLRAPSDSADVSGEDKAPRIVIRIPVIGGVNDDDDNIRESAAYVHDILPGAGMELLPYHRFGAVKYEALGIQYYHPEFYTPSAARMEELRDIVRAEGVSLADFR